VMVLVSGSTRTVGQLDASWPNHLGILLTPKNRNSVANVVSMGLRWAVDNGAFKGFDPVGFRRLVRKCEGQPRLLWVACPDVVGDARATLRRFAEWEPELRLAGVPVAFVLQDGAEDRSLPAAECYFVGGTTRFKLSEAAGSLMAEGKRRGSWVHMGRVNSRRRLMTALEAGCDSVDGSSLSMYGDKYIHKFCAWCRQLEASRREQPVLSFGDRGSQ
jgi:hypothetical protein